MCAINMVCAWPVCAFYVHATCMVCACPACAWCVPGVCLVCAWHAHTLFFLNPPTSPHTHAMPTQPHMPPPHAGAVGLSPLWRRAQAPCAACGTPTAASAAATPTAAAAAATHHMCRRHAHGCCRYCLCCPLPCCCRCKYVGMQSWLTPAASN